MENLTPPSYPAVMPILEPKEFKHGIYRNQCGTKFCAVGQVANAFGLSADPDGEEYRPGGKCVATHKGWDTDRCGGLDTVAPIGSPMHKFARRFAVNLGANAEEFDDVYEYRGLRALESVFEGGCHGVVGGPPTEAETAEAWNKTLRQLRYTTIIDR